MCGLRPKDDQSSHRFVAGRAESIQYAMPLLPRSDRNAARIAKNPLYGSGRGPSSGVTAQLLREVSKRLDAAGLQRAGAIPATA